MVAFPNLDYYFGTWTTWTTFNSILVSFDLLRSYLILSTPPPNTLYDHKRYPHTAFEYHGINKLINAYDGPQ